MLTSAAMDARKPTLYYKRRSGNADNPRILGAFNEQTPTGYRS